MPLTSGELKNSGHDAGAGGGAQGVYASGPKHTECVCLCVHVCTDT